MKLAREKNIEIKKKRIKAKILRNEMESVRKPILFDNLGKENIFIMTHRNKKE